MSYINMELMDVYPVFTFNLPDDHQHYDDDGEPHELTRKHMRAVNQLKNIVDEWVDYNPNVMWDYKTFESECFLGWGASGDRVGPKLTIPKDLFDIIDGYLCYYQYKSGETHPFSLHV